MVSEEKVPFQNLGDGGISIDLKKMLDDNREKFDKDSKVFQKEINEWKMLEDYMRAKVPKPSEPQWQIEIFAGCNVTSVDKLLDKDKVFITFERPEFRGEGLIKTLGVDLALVATGYKINTDISQGLKTNFDLTGKFATSGKHTEPGFYTLGPVKKDRYGVKEGLSQISEIAGNMFSFFTWKGE